MTKVSRKISLSAITFSLLFLMTSVAVPTVMATANSSPKPLASTPLTSIEANWEAADGNSFNQNYNPQNVINSSNVQNLGLSWLFPLPTHPTALLSVSGGLGVDTAPLIVNGTVFAITQYSQVFALNAANGNVLWTQVIPLTPNSTANINVPSLSLHLHDGAETFTTKLFGNTPTFWVEASNKYVYAFNALTGGYELNFSSYSKSDPVQGNNPLSLYSDSSGNILVDQQRGIAVTSMLSSSDAIAARCFYQGWNILVKPVQLMWTAYCSPPQVGSNIPVDPSYEIKQVNNMTGAWIFKGYGAGSPGGLGDATGAVNLKALSASALNATLYNDWGYVMSAHCAAETGGANPGATGAGWGAPWVVDEHTGIVYVNTGNKGPYASDCTPGPDLWAAATLALNDQTGQWIWGFQTAAHDIWDFDCSWQQVLANETISGVNTEVLFKTCKNGYLYELNAATGQMYWSWTPPTNIVGRCQQCYMLDPQNATQMSYQWPNPSGADVLEYPSEYAEFENEFAFNPATNVLFLGGQYVPILAHYIPGNVTNYGHTNGFQAIGTPASTKDNTTIFALNAATGATIWSHFIASQGYRGGITTSGNVVFLTLSSGDIQMLNAQTGTLIKDLYIGGPLNELATIGATASGTMEVVTAITAGSVSWGTGVPGDLLALTLQATAPANTVTSTSTSTTTATATGTVTSTTVSVSTVTSSTGVSSTTAYGIAAVAVIFIIATGYLAMRGRKPAS